MTSARVSRITGYECRAICGEARKVTYALFAEGLEILRASGYTPSEALENLLHVNFERVGQIAWQEQRGLCLACGKFASAGLQRHHIIPRSKGRNDDRLNIAMLDHKCHDEVTRGKELVPHLKMLDLIRRVGLEFTPTGWVRVEAEEKSA